MGRRKAIRFVTFYFILLAHKKMNSKYSMAVWVEIGRCDFMATWESKLGGLGKLETLI